MGRTVAYVDYQQRASEFVVGDSVFPMAHGDSDFVGSVTAVFPGIGMVDVEWPHGSQRMPVEDLQRYQAKDVIPPLPEHNNTPGGAGSVSVPGGPKKASVIRVAEAFVKRSLYWASKDRHYRATRSELAGGGYHCPKCKESALKKAIYKRKGGASDKLYGCPSCMFLIKACDIYGDDTYEDHTPEAPEASVDDMLDPLAAEWDGTMDQGFDSVREIQEDGAWA